MSAKAWTAAEKAQTLAEAHDALVALRPFPEADRSVWIAYYRRSAAVYWQVAEVDHDHRQHAAYWADRERAKANVLTAQAENAGTKSASRRRNGQQSKVDPTVIPASLEEAHELLSKARPKAGAGRREWLAYHLHAIEVYAEVAEVDRAHHYEALFFATFEQRKTVLFTGPIEDEPTACLDR